MKGPTLLLFTASYPWGTGELFLGAEMPRLEKTFSDILIFPIRSEAGLPATTGPNVKCYPVPPTLHLTFAEKLHWFFRAPRFILRALWMELRRIGWLKFSKNFRNNFITLLHAVRLAHFVRSCSNTINPQQVVAYSYWAWDWATVAALLRSEKHVGFAMTRGHGFDIYESQRDYHPLRDIQFQHLDAFVTISEDGRQYLSRIFPEWKHKLQCFRLGCPDRGENPFLSENRYRIVSCSALHSLKRVEQIAAALSLLTLPIEWNHFGEGPDENLLQEQLKNLPGNIHFIRKGQVANDDLMLYYQTCPVSLFLNFSSIEGIPFSIMEAISFGIPVIAPDNGGIREIVTPQTGILLPGDASPQQLAQAVGQFLLSEKNSPEFRRNVRQFWLENYSDEKNFGKFVRFLADGINE